jgi:peptidoglycan glycosyltransferase
MGVQLPPLKYFGPVAPVGGLRRLSRNLEQLRLFSSCSVLMLYAATGRIAYMIFGVSFTVGSYAAYQLFPHAGALQYLARSMVRPEREGYQITQSLYNVADGGITGTGLGRLLPDHPRGPDRLYLFDHR